MNRETLVRLLLATVVVGALGTVAQAQPLGTFSWQLAPYCNVVTVNVTQIGSTYTLDGYDTQCGGASNRAPVTGMAVPNPNGTIGLGFTIVTSPNGTPVHVDAFLTLTSLGGTWRDSLGHDGTFVFTPAGVASGNPRPLATVAVPDGSITTPKLADGAVTASKIDASSVQQRVQGSCPSGQLMTGVNQNGTVTCQAVSSGAGGDITAVIAGQGLAGGALSGNATLSVIYTGSGTANSAARADHTHTTGTLLSANTAVGEQALAANAGILNVAVGPLALQQNTTGGGNTATGYRALQANTTGAGNTAIGSLALNNSIVTSDNTAIGRNALILLSDGSENTALGAFALAGSTLSIENTAIGYGALRGNGSFGSNTAVGHQALATAGNGSNFNTALGQNALLSLTTMSSNNTAIGLGALSNLTAGGGNVALGVNSGGSLNSGSDNVYLATSGAAAESGTIRIGRSEHTRAFLAGVRGVTTANNNAVPVVVDSNGQLGTVSSSRRTKFDVHDMDASALDALHRLRPVQFRYLQAFADGSTPVQYGLIAEEVQDVMPDLVATDADGQPATVKYHVLPGLLLADVQRLERERVAQQQEIQALHRELAALRARLDGASAVAPH